MSTPLLPEAYALIPYPALAPGQQDEFAGLYIGLLDDIYGDQVSALDKIKSGADRSAEVVIDGLGHCAATLVYKHGLQSERFWDDFHGDDVLVKDGLEVKTLAIFNPELHGGKGIGSFLCERAVAIAQENNARSAFLTAREYNVMQFFIQNGFMPRLFMLPSANPANDTAKTLDTLMVRSLMSRAVDDSGKIFA